MKYLRHQTIKLLYSAAPGGYTLYWAVVIGVIITAGYLVGGLIPKRFPDHSKSQSAKVKPIGAGQTQSAIQLRSLEGQAEVKGEKTRVLTPTERSAR